MDTVTLIFIKLLLNILIREFGILIFHFLHSAGTAGGISNFSFLCILSILIKNSGLVILGENF